VVGGAVWLEALIGIAAVLVGTWLLLIIMLLWLKPKEAVLSQAARLLPDLLRLLRRLASDPAVPFPIRVRVWLLVAYLALPIDLVPDIVPGLGYADDLIITVLVLRWTMRRVGLDTVRRHWPGTADGLAALCRLSGLTLPSG
jgi:uncharacterized membrane protein YkvA (DUF1232 family)